MSIFKSAGEMAKKTEANRAEMTRQMHDRVSKEIEETIQMAVLAGLSTTIFKSTISDKCTSTNLQSLTMMLIQLEKAKKYHDAVAVVLGELTTMGYSWKQQDSDSWQITWSD